MRPLLALVGGLALSGPTTAAAWGQAIPTVAHVWKPIRSGGAQVTAIEVRTELRDFPASAGERFAIAAPITYAGVPGIAQRVQGLEVRDADGTVRFTVEDDTPDPGGFPYYRHWRAQRAVRFPVTVTYTSLAPDRPPAGPPFGLYAAHGGVSGAGSGFLVLPESDVEVVSRVRWDLGDLPPGAIGVTTWGEGDVEVKGRAHEVRQGWIMAGVLGRYPATGRSTGFSAVWLGTPTWDPATEMAWTARMYDALGRAYAYLDTLPSYRVFVRTGGRGGTALGNSFMIGAAPRAAESGASGEGPRDTFTHEMGHLFVGQIEAPVGVGSWFSEGLNTHYTRLLPMRGGFTSVEAYGAAINRDFEEYWFGEGRNLSADSIVRIGFTNDRIRHVPYVRGSFYLADLDTKIRAHSGGTRNLDLVLQEAFRRRQAGERFDHDAWIAIVTREAGPGARADFEGIILRGDRTVIPSSNAFGPCFARRETPPTTVNGTARGAGYEWVRVAGIPDAVCRAPW